MLDFDQAKGSMIEQRSPFLEILLHMTSEDDLIRDSQVEKLQIAIDDKIQAEKKRSIAAREAKTSATVYKIESEVIQIEKCYTDALKEVAPLKETRGLTAFEYCTMCIYYDS